MPCRFSWVVFPMVPTLMHDQIQEESGTSFGVSKTSPQKIDFAPHTMANEVWVELVIDGKNVGQAFRIKIPSETYIIDDLKRAIVNQTPELSSLSIGPASLLVHPAGTNILVPEDVKPLRPGLPLADLDFREITDETPLIVTAVSFLVRTHRALA
jgi:hypothetical protein